VIQHANGKNHISHGGKDHKAFQEGKNADANLEEDELHGRRSSAVYCISKEKRTDPYQIFPGEVDPSSRELMRRARGRGRISQQKGGEREYSSDFEKKKSTKKVA